VIKREAGRSMALVPCELIIRQEVFVSLSGCKKITKLKAARLGILFLPAPRFHGNCVCSVKCVCTVLIYRNTMKVSPGLQDGTPVLCRCNTQETSHRCTNLNRFCNDRSSSDGKDITYHAARPYNPSSICYGKHDHKH